MVRARTTRAAGTHRLVSSIRLPLLVGVALMLLLSVAMMTLLGRTRSVGPVPRVVADQQQQTAERVAQVVRRSGNEGVADLEALAASLAISGTPKRAAELQPAVAATRRIHNRYTSVFVTDASGTLVASDGAQPHPELLPVKPTAPGLSPLRRAGTDTLLVEWAPVPNSGFVVAANYDPSRSRLGLDLAGPGAAWVVDADGHIVATTGDEPLLSLLPTQRLRDAAASGAAGRAGVASDVRGAEQADVVAWAPVRGIGPAGAAGWSVVLSRSTSSLNLPTTAARRQGLLAGILLLIVSTLVFGWLYAVVFRPIEQLRADAERVAYGDLRQPVEIRRYDELGVTARAVERTRVLLIRQRVIEDAAGATQPDATERDTAAQPDATQPDATQADAAQPDATQADAAQPDATQQEQR